ncbi:DUF3291 domain-containing protein [Roseibacterium sp. SDUM158017]|uniref:DUF3291 domain-containing protein n=1 Tax=Roseicyclus salinarum TaxID=3036773 RepID=UPI0024156076|nr:DUF3291 domain-containing protein [Roseibacterium sp. SDUM158017]MDG4649088.1 DUF3291 domain-containing protein [Roseibacterium sp. SDUM158017]
MRHPAGHHVAQLNVGQLWHPLDDPRTAGFTDNAGKVNAIADRSPGFVWRLVEDGQASLRDGVTPYPGDPCALRTLSVWEGPEALEHFVMRTLHGTFLKRREAWFRPQDHRTYVIWPVPAGHLPEVREGLDRLADLERDGPTDAAYDFAYLGAART